MFKLVVLFSVLALAAAKPDVWAPFTYNTVPAVSSVSQYSGNVYHGSPVVPTYYNAQYSYYPATAGVHHLAKRSVVPFSYSSVVSPVTPVSSYHGVVSPLGYSSPFVSAYSAPYTHAYSYPAVVPKALSVHPW
ncbi:uncharacterized protein LOC123660009 [Melitaea cinxia]|uniref:uncharacterized protein LOC123660009 n=1 Tax=Melitaea cinxia TaxID=113334 RepID=UPI001E271011|nr:uncharacterized protein LOC123660009 [Melitaea cinxia]